MAALDRGLYTYIRGVAKDVRRSIGLTQFVRIDPWAAADSLGIPVIPLTDLDGCRAVVYFGGAGLAEFSAATGFVSTSRFIVVNDHHHPNRQASSVAHELGHALLQHPPAPVLTGDGFRNWDGDTEEQAAYFAGVLLVPDEACRWIMKDGLSLSAAARLFGVSEHMIDYRLNKSGARLIHRRALAKRR